MLEEHRLLFRLYGALPPGVEGPRHGEGSRHGQSPSAECKPGERSRKISPPSSHEKVSTGAREEDVLLKTSVSFLMLKSFKRAQNARLIQDCFSLSQAMHSDCKKRPALCSRGFYPLSFPRTGLLSCAAGLRMSLFRAPRA